MAVHTELSDAEMRGFLRLYDAGALRRFRGIAEGVENSNFYVETESGKYIATLFERRVKEQDLPFFMELMQFLAARGVACPQPLALRGGGFLTSIKNRPAAMVSFLQGHSARSIEVQHCASLGAALAELHKAGQSFTLRRANDFALPRWGALWQSCRAAEPAALQAEIDADLAALARLWPSDLPQGIIHADLFPDNVLFAESGKPALIDFYFACTDSLAYDIGICLNAWCFDAAGAWQTERAAALLRAYHAERGLSKAERAALPLLARGAAMRFFLTRCCDWQEAPAALGAVKKPPQEYLAKLRFWRACPAEILAF